MYKARDAHLDRFVAIKVLLPETVADPERVRRFVQEAKAASSLNHPHIVVIHDIAQADGVHFIAMEYVPGWPLDKLIPRKGLRLNEALRYAIQIADALSAAHSAGIVHRDIKPGNIMVTDDGRVKVLDFGLAKLTGPADSDGDALTRSLKPETSENVILGTVSYMSPEQAEGRKVDARSDIFSFGSVLYEMVTGQQPFRKETRMSTISAILQQEPKPPAEVVESVPRDLEKIIARCLRKNLDRRFQSMADVMVELKELKEESESGTSMKPVPIPTRRWMWIAGVVAVVALAATILWLLRPWTISAPENPLTSLPLTSYPGNEHAPSFSPDGSQVAFSWNEEQQDNFDIYVKLIGPGTPLRLTRNPARDTALAWSPDGRWIAFRRDVGAGKSALFVIPALGGPERKLLETAISGFFWESLSWHPGGNWLAFADRDPPEARVGLFAVSITSGQKRRLTSPPAPSNGDGNPAFSPDGRALAFCRRMAMGEGDLFLLPLSTAGEPEGEPEQLTFEHRETRTPAWTPDGREIIYSVGAPGSFNLWRLRLSQSRAPQGKPERLALVGEDGILPALSRQGRRPAYTRWWRDLNIWRVQIPGGVPAPFISSSRSEENPKFSPDGTKIAFRSDRSGHNEVWVCDSDGLNASQLTSFGGAVNADLNWSPDGRRIAFKSTAHGHGDIYVINAEGGTPERLTTEPSDDLMPAWSHDGRWIYFASNRSGTDEVWKMPASGGSSHRRS